MFADTTAIQRDFFSYYSFISPIDTGYLSFVPKHPQIFKEEKTTP